MSRIYGWLADWAEIEGYLIAWAAGFATGICVYILAGVF